MYGRLWGVLEYGRCISETGSFQKNMAKRKFNVLALVGLFMMICWLLMACAAPVTLSPPTPVPPKSFENLPKHAVVDCNVDSRYLGMPINLWNHEARIPLDPSDSNPDRGGNVGSVMFCEEIVVLDFAWSPYYEEFWFLIETPEGTQGWITGEYIVLQNE